jgi:hypothetical protein
MEFLQPGVPITVPLIPTTFGWMHPSQVEMRPTVLRDDDDVRVVRTDKFTLDGQWCGNDLDIKAKRWPDAMHALTGLVGG